MGFDGLMVPVTGLGIAGAGYYFRPSTLPCLCLLHSFVGGQMDFYHLKLPLINPSLNKLNTGSSVLLIQIQYLADWSYRVIFSLVNSILKWEQYPIHIDILYLYTFLCI